MNDYKQLLNLRNEIIALRIEVKELRQKVKEYESFYKEAVKENKRLRRALNWKGLRLKLNKFLDL